MSEKIRIVMVKRGNMSAAELARRVGWSAQNMSNKLKRDNWTQDDLTAIAEALGCRYRSEFEMTDTGEIV